MMISLKRWACFDLSFLSVKNFIWKFPSVTGIRFNIDLVSSHSIDRDRERILGRLPGYVNFTKVILFLRRPHILIDRLKRHQDQAPLPQSKQLM